MKFIILFILFITINGCIDTRYEMKSHECEIACEPRRFKIIQERFVRSETFDNDIRIYRCFCRSDDGNWISYKTINK